MHSVIYISIKTKKNSLERQFLPSVIFGSPPVTGFEHTMEYISSLDRYELGLIVQLYAYTYGKDSPILVRLGEKKLFLYGILEGKAVL